MINNDVLYNGHIINVKSSKVTVPNETKEDGEDENESRSTAC